MLTHFSLFTGIGGADLAAEWAGFESIGQVEWADYPTKVLEKHWPNVPRWRDICDVTGESVRRTINNRAITVVSGGFPCQPFSVAGKRKGKDDDRFLWPEMLRVISELKPTWVIGENVAGFVNMGLEAACIDLENQGYEVQPLLIPACSVGAWHKRERVFIIAYSDGNGRNNGEHYRQKRQIQDNREWNSEENKSEWNGRVHRPREICSVFQNTGCELWKRCEQLGPLSNEIEEGNADKFERPGEMVFDSTSKRCKESNNETGNISEGEIKWKPWSTDGTLGQVWEFEPDVGRVANGIPTRVDRLKCLGNAIVPQQIYPIFKAIADIEGGLYEQQG